MARHAQLSKEQLDEILRNTDSRNTKIATNSAVATFQSYLNSAFGYDPISMQSFTPATLDSALTFTLKYEPRKPIYIPRSRCNRYGMVFSVTTISPPCVGTTI
jgi:hypothetical protein